MTAGAGDAARTTGDIGDVAAGTTLAIDAIALDAAGLAATFGTPLYVYDLDVVARRVSALRSVLPRSFSLAYAVKANPSLAVVAHLASLGLGADVASRGELATVLRAGMDPGRVIVTGPGKTADEHRAAVRARVRAITVESPGELERLERVAAEERHVVPVLLRASVADADRPERLRIIGDAGAGKFGMDADDLRLAARAAAGSCHVDLLGIHRFGASNVTDAAALSAHVAATVELARDVLGGTGATLRVVDVGGGLGIPYGDGEPALDLGDLGTRLARLADRWRSRSATAAIRVVVEPGRYLVGPAGLYLVRVVDRKSVAGVEVATVDGGIHHLLRPALVGQEHRLRVVDGRAIAATPPVPVTIAGPLCTGLDVFASRAPIPVPGVGDLVAVLDAGAYGFTESMPFFLSHPTPAEVVLREGVAHLGRRRMQPEDWLAAQTLSEA